jgi:hypothetical protein
VSTDTGPRRRQLGYFRAVRVLGFIAILAACNFQSTPAPATEVDASAEAPGSDAAALDAAPVVDAAILPDAQLCYGVGVVKVCFPALPSGTVNLPGGVNPLDTSVNASCTLVVAQQGGPPLCVIAGTTVTVSGTLVAIGTRPLVLVATDVLTVSSSGTIDVSSISGNGARRGAGGSAAECSHSDSGQNDSGGAGGGAGGSFGTVGGKGGTGDQNNSALPIGSGLGGTAGTVQIAPTVLHGGCAGGAGGAGSVDPRDTGGAGGDGGGAVYLIAGSRIAIDNNGNVFASGAGGRVTAGAGGRQEGAGGGGSGGMIGLGAPTIQVQGRVVANGGGGGGGGGNVGGTSGGNGSTMQWNQRAVAGAGDPVPPPNGPAGDGAQGTATGGTTNLDGISSDLGAGGGAGGLGLIWTYGTLNGGAMMSPAPNQH